MGRARCGSRSTRRRAGGVRADAAHPGLGAMTRRCDVNGRAGPAARRRARYVEMRRTWTAGDVVELDLPMPVRLVEANPYVEETRNHVAVMRGPLVYCLESTDLPAACGCSTCACRATRSSTPRRDGRARRRRRCIEGKALAVAAGRVVGPALPRLATPRRPKDDRPEADPVLRLGQPRRFGDDRLAAAGALRRRRMMRRNRFALVVHATAYAIAAPSRAAADDLQALVRQAGGEVDRGVADRQRPAGRDGVRRDGRGADPVQRGHALDRQAARLRPRRRRRCTCPRSAS